jgi:magnesium transporter
VPHFGVIRRLSGALEEGLEPRQLAEALREEGTVGWLDLEAPAPEEVGALEALFGFHPLAIEDAQNPETRPKIEEYEGFLFVVTRGINHDPEAPALDLVPLYVFLSRYLVVTVHTRPMRSVATALERLRKHPELLQSGPDRLLHHLLDHVVDDYFPCMEHLEDRIEGLEDEVFKRPDEGVLQRIFETRKDLMALRRGIGPLRDVYDHVLRLLDELETNREILSGLLESYLSQISNRTNAVMKRLTVLATIGLPFTVVSGYFGMNFEVMPWLKEQWGVIAATVLMVAISAGVLVSFKRNDWL